MEHPSPFVGDGRRARPTHGKRDATTPVNGYFQTATGFQAATVPRQPGSSSSAVARVSSDHAPAASSWSGGYLANLPLAFQLHQERGESVAELFDA
jgi:hypothetical protein